jgi:hypothetical protein
MAGSRPSEYAAGLLPPTWAYEGKRVIRLRFRAAAPPGGLGTTSVRTRLLCTSACC